MKDLNNQEWQEAINSDKSAQIIDVRTEEELSEGMIGKAMHLDIHQPQAFMDGINTLDKNGHYYVYCRAGGRSAQACQIMEQLGFSNTYNLSGGFSNWDGPVSHKDS